MVTQEERAWDSEEVKELLRYDTCCEITNRSADPTEPPRYAFNFGPHEVEIKYIYKSAIPSTGLLGSFLYLHRPARYLSTGRC